MRLNRRSLYFPAVTLTVLTITLTVILAISTYRNLHREQEQMEESLTREGLALLRLFETVAHSHDYELEEEAAQVQQLAVAVAPNADIAYIFMFDQQGRILAHSNQSMVGKLIDGGIPKGSEILSFIKGHIFEIRSDFHPVPSNHYLGIGLKMSTLKQAHHEDRRHTMMMAAMLILLGSGSLFFIIVVQNFYLVQRTLNQMKSYIHYVVESMANGLISLDSAGAVTTINQAAQELIGISEAEAKSLEIDGLLQEHAVEIQNVLENNHTILNKEIVYQHSNGSAIPVNLSATQVKDERGVKLGVVILLNDMREMVELQERAKRAEHLASIGRMAATVAHEIRNPLSSVRGFAQFFANRFVEKTEERTYALAMMEESNRLNRVVSELLDYARPLELKIEPTSIETLFLDIVRRLELEQTASDIEIIQEVQPDMPTVQLDHDRILQVLLNLTQNSIDAMPNGGKLILSAVWLAERNSVQIGVRDTGKGIPKSDLPRLFEPFFTTKTRGAGLGLAVVRKIVDAHNGEVEVKSEEGVGTQVILTTPQSKT
jgi:two-component system sensor histidine kinase HydH